MARIVYVSTLIHMNEKIRGINLRHIYNINLSKRICQTYVCHIKLKNSFLGGGEGVKKT